MRVKISKELKQLYDTSKKSQSIHYNLLQIVWTRIVVRLLLCLSRNFR